MANCELIVRAIITQNDSLLVNQGRRPHTNELYYALPGGHVEEGETCTEALQRELKEELAIECNIGDLSFVIEHLYAGRHAADKTRHELTLYFNTTVHSIIPQNGEHIISPEPTKNFRWLSLGSLGEAPLLPEISRVHLQKYFSHQQISHYAFQDSTSKNSN